MDRKDSDRTKIVEDIFQSAADHSPDERAAYLDEVCNGDTQLRREVESMISSYERAGSFMDKPAIAIDAHVLREAGTNAQVGQQIGHYTILKEIGRGGMGEVYLAEDTALGRRIALKVLPAFFTRDDQRVRRFQQEARAASALNHPNILTIHEIGNIGSTYFIATEFIEGQTLRDRVCESPVRLPEVLEIATQTASALTAAHQAGLVHRDIKPENIMLRPDGLVKVLDFGLVKLTEEENDLETAPLTRTTVDTNAGMVMGTASYMSPEQARGSAVDGRTDIWSLGVVLYELIAARLPFEGSNTNQILASILSDKEPLPLVRVASGVPAELARIVEKALSKNRDERYQTSKDMLLDLKKLKQRLHLEAELARSADTPKSATDGSSSLDRDLVTSRSSTAGTRETAREATRSTRIFAGSRRLAVGIVFVAIFIGVAVVLLYRLRTSSATGELTTTRSIAVLPFENASGNADVDYLSDGMTETLINSLAQVPNLAVKARTSVFRYKNQNTSLKIVGKELGVEAVLTGRMVQHGDDLTLFLSLVDATTENQLWGKQYDQKLTDLVRLQTQIAEDVSENLKAKLTTADQQKLSRRYTANPEAYRLYLQGRYLWNKRTERDMSKSLEYFQQAVALDPNYALAYTGIADAYVNLSMGFNFGPMQPSLGLPKAKEAALKALEIDNTLAEAHVSLAVIKERWDWDFATAEREYKRAIELNKDYATAHQRYSVFLGAMGHFDEAVAEIERARQLDPLSLVIAVETARPYTLSGNYDRAVEILGKVIEIDPNFMRAHHLLAINYSWMGRNDEAIREIQKAFELVGGQYREDRTKRINDTLAVIYAHAGRRSEALKLLADMEEQEKQGKYSYVFTHSAVYSELGDREQAFKWLEKAYAERSPAMVDLKAAHVYDKIRDDTRFTDLVRRVGLPQ
jgi:serine/threonine-protein kinase